MGGRFANREPNRNSGGRSVREPLTEPNRRGAPTSRNANRTGYFFANFRAGEVSLTSERSETALSDMPLLVAWRPSQHDDDGAHMRPEGFVVGAVTSALALVSRVQKLRAHNCSTAAERAAATLGGGGRHVRARSIRRHFASIKP